MDELSFDVLAADISARAAMIDPAVEVELQSAYLDAARERLAPASLDSLRIAVAALQGQPATRVKRIVHRWCFGTSTHDVTEALRLVVAALDETLAAARSDLLAEINALNERLFQLERRTHASPLQNDGGAAETS